MKAITYNSYGGPEVLQLTEIDKPKPRENEVLIKVHAASLNALDWRMMRASPFFIRFMQGLFKPTSGRVGADVSGTVEAIGSNVTAFQPGDEVFGETLKNNHYGSCAEYICAEEKYIARKPKGVSFEAAAAIPIAGITVYQGLRDHGRIQPGQKVLINGASGGVGTFAVQIAKAMDAEVTAVCSTGKIDMVRSLGADHVIDYTKEDFTKTGQMYDLVFAANGDRPVRDYLRIMNSKGTYACAGGSMRQLFQAMLLGPIITMGSGKMTCGVTSDMNSGDLESLAEMVVDGKVSPVIDRCYSLEDTKEAMMYLDEGHVMGKVVIELDVFQD